MQTERPERKGIIACKKKDYKWQVIINKRRIGEERDREGGREAVFPILAISFSDWMYLGGCLQSASDYVRQLFPKFVYPAIDSSVPLWTHL